MKANLKFLLLAGFMLFQAFSVKAQVELTLENALKIAKEKNRGLKAQLYEAQHAREATRESRNQFLPGISAQGNYSYFFNRPVIFMPGSFVGDEQKPVVDVAVGGLNTFNSILLVQQPIISEMNRRQIKNAVANEAIQSQATQDKEASLAYDISSRFYTLLLIRENIKLQQQSLERNLKSLEDSRNLLLQGKALKVDTLKGFIVVENLKNIIFSLENQYQVSLINLKNMLDMNMGQEIKLIGSLMLEERDYATFSSRFDERLKYRPDIQAQKLKVEISRNMISQAKAQKLPNLALIGAYQVQAQNDDRNFPGNNWPQTSYVGIQATMPVFNGFRTNSQIKQSHILLKQREIELADMNANAMVEISAIRNNLEEAFQRLAIQKKTEEAAIENFKIIQERYQKGLSQRIELSDAELALSEAKLNFLKTIFDIKINRLLFDKALGQLKL